MTLSYLQTAHDYSALAIFFGVPASRLKSHLYLARGYCVFEVPKKNGGYRRISAPVNFRKSLQKSLLPVLVDTYRPNPAVHGFVSRRSVRTNAKPHVGRRTLINVDLLDFFGSISFQRIRGIFLAPPFRFSWATANVLAQICCDQGFLPAGGVTSPTLSNMICAKMDKRLASLCQRLGGTYTRYADDMTMSFDRPLQQLNSLVQFDDLGVASPGKALIQVISEEGFTINLEKFRAATNMQRKIVTGLVVNEKVNARRSWYLSLESVIYAIEKFGLQLVSSKEFPDEANTEVASRKLLRRTHGKLAYYRMIRGNGDWMLCDLANRFNRLHDDSRLRVPSAEVISRRERLGRGVLIVVAYEEPMQIFGDTIHQGTAFVTKSGLLITAAHVLCHGGNLLPFIYVMNERQLRLFKCEVLAHDFGKDIAIMHVPADAHDLIRHRFKVGPDCVNEDRVSAVGFPGYDLRDTYVAVPGLVTRVMRPARFRGRTAVVDAPLQAGMSGGPVIGDDCSVRAVVQRDDTAAGGVAEAVQISEVIALAVASGLRL